MDRFLEKHKLLILICGKIVHLNNPISIKGIESIMNNLPKRRHHAQMVSLVNSTKKFKEIILISYNILQKIEVEGTFYVRSMRSALTMTKTR